MSASESQAPQPVQPTSTLTVLSRQDVDALKEQRALLREFVQSQLKEANFALKADDPMFGKGDYGIIPGTNTRSLFKQGAEKLCRLFRLGSRFEMVDKIYDPEHNYAEFVYRCEIYDLRAGTVIANCEASVSSQEKKYSGRTVWKDVFDAKGKKTGRESKIEPTPIHDIMNTMRKMAQKRALVGATILATGASEFFTQDMLDEDDLREAAAASDPKASGEKPPTKDVPSEPAKEEPTAEAPICHGKPMRVSLYADRETGEIPWYCLTCKGKKPRVQT